MQPFSDKSAVRESNKTRPAICRGTKCPFQDDTTEVAFRAEPISKRHAAVETHANVTVSNICLLSTSNRLNIQNTSRFPMKSVHQIKSGSLPQIQSTTKIAWMEQFCCMYTYKKYRASHVLASSQFYYSSSSIVFLLSTGLVAEAYELNARFSYRNSN